MNIHQQELMNLLIELDAFCSEHDITYYCAGGTVIGAARHRGFIPWDDDIDVYMTRSEFRKFSDALKKYGPEDRVLEYYEGNHEMQTGVPRYHREDTTLFCHFNLFGRSSAGTSLDVFILDPIPDGHEERLNYLSAFYAYNDIIGPALTYSNRLPADRAGKYHEARAIAEKEGRPRAVEELSKEIFNYDESECSAYCLRWGSIPLIYPIDVIGKPSYLPFEGMMIPVPQDWYMYLVIHYGMEWFNLPYEETQHKHTTIVRYDMKYDYFYDKRDEVYSQDYLLDLHFRWKDSVVELQRQNKNIESFLVDTKNAICRATLNKRIAQSSEGSVEALFQKEKYAELIEVFNPYIALQTSNAYIGQRMRHGSQFRWFFPVIMPLSEAELDAILTALIRTRKHRLVEKLVGVYERANESSEAVDKAAFVIKAINDASKNYYHGDYDAAEKQVKEVEDWERIPALDDLAWLCDSRMQMSEEKINALKGLVEDGKASEAQKKAWGDYLWSAGETDEAAKVYNDLMKESRNGMFWMEIHDKGVDIPPIPTKRLTPFTEDDITTIRRRLLEEIVDICDRNDIRYVLHPDLGRRIFKTGNIGYSSENKDVFMDAENALKFREAYYKEKRSNRKLLSWLDGDTIRDFSLVYTDTENVFCDFRRLDQWKNMGVFITIRILRRKKAPEMYKKSILLDEFTVNLITLENLDKRNLQSKRKKVAYQVFSRTTPGGKRFLLRNLFNRSVKTESKCSEGDFYYYTNIKGMKPKKNRFSEDNWENVEILEMNEVKYRVPAAVTKVTVPVETNLLNIPQTAGNFVYKSTDMTWDEITPLIDEDRYLSLNWDEYAKARRNYRKLNYQIKRCWKMVLKEGEELELKENAAKIAEEYKAAIERGDEDSAAEAIKIVDETMKEYDLFDVPVYLEKELRACYEDYLDRSDQGRFKNKMISLWDKDKSEYYNNA